MATYSFLHLIKARSRSTPLEQSNANSVHFIYFYAAIQTKVSILHTFQLIFRDVTLTGMCLEDMSLAKL